MISVVPASDLLRPFFFLLSAVPGALVCGSLIYLLVLLAAAVLLPTRRARRAAGDRTLSPAPRLAVVIPAHNEQMVLAATLHSLRQQEYAPDAFDIVVVADNCTDTTADIAREWGVIVMERENLQERGKGYALEWAFERLLGSDSPTASAEAYFIVDADTQLAPDFLLVMAERLKREAASNGDAIADSSVVLQGRYGVLNPGDGWRTALMTAAFDLCNHVRLLGAANLGLSVGLKGNGMAFSRGLLMKARWQGRSITEDIDYGLDLLQQHNVRVGYEPAAHVWAQMPSGEAPAASQRERWERGRYRLLRQRVPGLLWDSLRLRQPALFVAAIDLTIPPLAELLGLLVLWGAFAGGGVALGQLSTMWLWVWGVAAASFVIYVLAGLRASGAKRETFLALLHVPVYVGWKAVLYLKRFVGGSLRRSRPAATSGAAPVADGQSADDWIRTERTALSPGATPIVRGAVATPTAQGGATRTALKEEQRP